MNTLPESTQALLERGVEMPAPQTVYIAPEVDLDRIAGGALVHPGCRLHGKTLSVGPGCELGAEAPVTLDNCQLDANVKLAGGYFCGATFRSNVQFGASAHVRPGTLLEEEVTCGHAVGLKQTILLPFVTTGSLINFCDILMAGGTSRTDHSEVGSSYVHFNFRPQRDKATASLVGDVPRGVMLDQPAIFLGGQGGLVGPTRIEYGTIIAAGVICRRDALQPGHLVLGGAHPGRSVPYQPKVYGDISRLLRNNLLYIGNLQALLQWQLYVRALFVGKPWQCNCQEGAVARLHEAITERLKQLARLHANLEPSLALARAKHGKDLPQRPFQLQQRFLADWPQLKEQLAHPAEDVADSQRDALLQAVSSRSSGNGYVDTLRALRPDERQPGTEWLQTVVDHYAGAWLRD